MSEYARVLVEAHVRYESVKKKIKVFLTPTDKLDELNVTPSTPYAINHASKSIIQRV